VGGATLGVWIVGVVEYDGMFWVSRLAVGGLVSDVSGALGVFSWGWDSEVVFSSADCSACCDS
jgi:hypothetical protein